MKITKKARKEFVRHCLATRKKWATKGLLAIYKYQTSEEQAVVRTLIENGLGFTKADDETLSVFAHRLKVHDTLTPKEWTVVHKKLPKYWRQILEICNLTKLDILLRRHATKKMLQLELPLNYP
jgi:hypothetical protein